MECDVIKVYNIKDCYIIYYENNATDKIIKVEEKNVNLTIYYYCVFFYWYMKPLYLNIIFRNILRNYNKKETVTKNKKIKN